MSFTAYILAALSLAYVGCIVVVLAFCKAAKAGDEAAEQWLGMPDLRAEREARVAKVKELVLENRG